MADNFLEKHMLEYEKRKAKWLAKKKHRIFKTTVALEKPEDEAL